jgi:hypothetical protein
MIVRNGHRKMLIGAAVLGAAAAAAAWANPQGRQKQSTPESWSYELRDGKRVPRGEKTTNPDGSWREVVRRGDCELVREKNARGEYRETTRCD